VSVADTPDLLPTIAVLGAVADGTTRIVDCEHVRYKETDRVTRWPRNFTAMGASVDEEQDTLTVHGSASDLQGATVDSRADHRIIMSLAIAGLVADGETTVEGCGTRRRLFPRLLRRAVRPGSDCRPVAAVTELRSCEQTALSRPRRRAVLPLPGAG